MKKQLFTYRLYVIPLLILLAIPIWDMLYPSSSAADTSTISEQSVVTTPATITKRIELQSIVKEIFPCNYIAEEFFDKWVITLQAPAEESILWSHSTEELFAKADTLIFSQGNYSHRYSFCNDPKVALRSDDYLLIARTFANLYSNDEWSGVATNYKGYPICIDWTGEISVNGVLTGIRVDDAIYHDIAEELYLRGAWDGTPMELGSHTVSLSDKGQLLVDGYIVRNYVSCIDDPSHPDYNTDSNNHAYVPGKGDYVTIEQNLVRLFKHKKLLLPGGPLEFNEINFDELSKHGHELYYCSKYDKMFLVFYAAGPDYEKPQAPDYRAKDLRRYLYIFPDYNVSKIEFVSEINDCSIDWNIYKDQFFYQDMSGKWWDYTDTGFVESEYPLG